MGCINDAIDEGDPLKTLESLQLPTAKIKNVDPDYAQHYQDVLYHAKSQKLMVSLSKFGFFTFIDGVREKAEGRIFVFYTQFFLKLMSLLFQQLPVSQDGSNKAVIFLVLRGSRLHS